MRKIELLKYAVAGLAAAGLAALTAPAAWAQGETDTATADATATVVQGIVLTQWR